MIFEKDVLYVDSREPQQIFNKLEKSKVEYVKTFLDVGDFVFNDIVIERKEIIDFYQSVQGRMWEQVENMKENFDRCFVLISGNVANCYKRIPHFNENIILGAIASLTTKRGVQVIRCENDSQLIRQLLALCRKSTEPYEGFVKRIAIKDEDVFTSMVACVPGIGLKMAKLILAEYQVHELYNVSIKDLRKINGIGKKTAETIKRYYNVEK